MKSKKSDKIRPLLLSRSVSSSSLSNSSGSMWSSGEKIIEKFTSKGIECNIHVWCPLAHHHQQQSMIFQSEEAKVFSEQPSKKSHPRGVVCIYHGLAGQGRFATVRYMAELLATYNYKVYSIDFPWNCGYSGTKKKKASSAKDIVDHAVNLALYAKSQHPDLPLFLSGIGIDGSIALIVSTEIENRAKKCIICRTCTNNVLVSGMILISPTITTKAPCFSLTLLSTLSKLVSKKPILCTESHTGVVKCSDGTDTTCWDDIDSADLFHSGNSRVDSVACINLITMLRKSLTQVTRPFLCLVVQQDSDIDDDSGVADTTDVSKLMRAVKSKDKTLIEYDDTIFHHLQREQNSLRQKIEHDILSWLTDQTIDPAHLSSYPATMRSDSAYRRQAAIKDLEEALFEV